MVKSFLGRVFVALRAKRQEKFVAKFGVGSKWYGGDLHCSSEISIGDFVYIGPDFIAHAFGGINVGDGTVIGPRLTIHTRNHNFENAQSIPYDGEYALRGVKIGKGVWIGDSVILLPGACIGDGAVIGAGSVVSGFIPDYSIAAGNPAVVIRERKDKTAAERLVLTEAYYLKNKIK
jgi:acetyltransferase-like isoleucine patch superfamily enzyme